MTELLTRAQASDGEASAVLRAQSVWWRGTLSALWAVSVGVATLLVVVLIAWATDSRAASGAGVAIRTALAIWLVAHRVPLAVPGGSVAIAPLLLTLALAFLVARAAAVLARGQEIDDVREVGIVALAVGLPYAVLTTFVAAAAHSADVQPSPFAALVSGLVLGCVAAGWGAARGSGMVGEVWARVPDSVRTPIAAGAAAAGVLLAGATLVLLVALMAHIGEAAGTVRSLGGGGVAAAAIVALDVALLPNAAVCVMGYLAGPGFAVGAGTTITATGARPADLPALPLLAAVPSGPVSVLVEIAGIAVLVAAGVLAAWLVAREGRPLLASMGRAAGAGATAGVVAALLAALAGGPAGPGRMSVVGTSPWQLGLVVAGEAAVVACGAAGALTWRRGR